jgi:hypothetical protein
MEKLVLIVKCLRKQVFFIGMTYFRVVISLLISSEQKNSDT